jgi:hypothetical protein
MRNKEKGSIASSGMATTPAGSRCGLESGQIMVSLLLMLSIFLLAMVGFAVDLTNLWFHRQAAQTAADAACNAGAADMLMVAVGTPMPRMGFIPGTPGDCTSGAGTICFYANVNGYNGAGFSAGSPSNSVTWSFPSSIAGVTAPPSSLTANPFLKVVVSENVKTHFLYTIHGTTYQQVVASCTCGVTGAVPQAAPILVLNPTIPEALHLTGGSHIVIVGGPTNSIQVNSSANGQPNANSTSNAVECDGGSGNPIDTSMAGPKGAGGYLSIHGGPLTNQFCGASYILNDPTGTLWKSPVATFANPYSSLPAPTLPPAPVAASHPVPGAPAQPTTQGTWVATGVDSCPNTNPTQHYLTYSAQYGNVYGNCLEFNPGYYPSGIDLGLLAGYGNDVAIFMPGIYYLNGNLHVSSSTTVRNAWIGAQPDTEGVMFYFINGGPVFDGGSGQPSSSINTVPSYYLNCNGTLGSTLMPSSLTGNILAAECTAGGTYAGVPSTDVLSAAGNRGLLFNLAPSDVYQGTVIGAGASLNFTGVLYFHNSTYQDQVTLNGAGTSTSYLLGNIVTDQLTLAGSGTIKMGLAGGTSATNSPGVAMFQ